MSLPQVDPAARSCELLLVDKSAAVVRARFGASLRGTFIRQAPSNAIAFHALEDAAIDASEVDIELSGPGGFSISRVQCFDRDGKAIAGGGLASKS